jgi:hypothetical protein
LIARNLLFRLIGDALFSHFAFYTQRPFLEGATVLLDQYGDLLTGRDSPSHRAMLAIKSFFKPATLIGSSFAWQYLWYVLRDIRTRLTRRTG